jgi:hypothetical protein
VRRKFQSIGDANHRVGGGKAKRTEGLRRQRSPSVIGKQHLRGLLHFSNQIIGAKT